MQKGAPRKGTGAQDNGEKIGVKRRRPRNEGKKKISVKEETPDCGLPKGDKQLNRK